MADPIEAAELLRGLASRLDGSFIDPVLEETNLPLDWDDVYNSDFNYNWLVDRFWPEEYHLHLFASPKTGKSLLTLWIAANMAMGVDPFSGATMERIRVTYFDNEMTVKDVADRLGDMGFDIRDLKGWLFYYLYPVLAPMDTAQGGIETLALMEANDSKVLIIDTLSRVVKGEENSNDTYRAFYNHTGRLLKANKISMLRLDHAGHDPKKSRGASAKADDVDLVFGLEKRSSSDAQPGYVLNRTHARVSGIDETITLTQTDDPLTIRVTSKKGWTAQAITKAKELDALGISVDCTFRECKRLLSEGGYVVGKALYLAEALRLRKAREGFSGLVTVRETP